jgi:hypothetical protein
VNLWLVAATHWMLLHGVANQSYWVNMDTVTSLRAPLPSDLRGSFAAGTRCVVLMSDGKFIAVTESCETVYGLIAAAR